MQTLADTTKRCPRCNEVKGLFAFTIPQTGKRAGMPVSQCKTCRAETARQANAGDETLYRRVQWPSKLRTKYGIEPEEYYAMLEAQGGGCALCKASTPSDRHYKRRGKAEMFHVDHCHATGRVRGLLCHLCNRALGLIRDNADLADRMSAYLRKGE